MRKAVIWAGSIALLSQNAGAAKPQFNKSLEQRFMTACVTVTDPGGYQLTKSISPVFKWLGKFDGPPEWDKGFGETSLSYIFQAVRKDELTGQSLFFRLEFKKIKEIRTEEKCGPESVYLNRILLRGGGKEVIGSPSEATFFLMQQW